MLRTSDRWQHHRHPVFYSCSNLKTNKPRGKPSRFPTLKSENDMSGSSFILLPSGGNKSSVSVASCLPLLIYSRIVQPAQSLSLLVLTVPVSVSLSSRASIISNCHPSFSLFLVFVFSSYTCNVSLLHFFLHSSFFGSCNKY